ncbi:MAG: response regulator [Bacteroidales bacterium]|nr:response regulator [Bacteroidales bacterium]
MNKKILIIDDYAPLLEEVSEFLEMENYTVFTAKNGAEGVQKAITTEPDMIICDILMPELDGYQVFQTISQIPSLSTIPFIFLTARATSEDYRKGLDLGVDDYLTKPFTIDALLSSITRRFEKVEKYKSVKKDVVEFLFTNPMLGIFIFSETAFVFQNKKIEEITSYTTNDLNEIDPSKVIIGNLDEIQKNLGLIKAGIHKSLDTEIGLIKKDKTTIFIKLFMKSIVFEGKNSFIGCITEKEQYNSSNDVAPSVEKFMNFLADNNNKEISEEISLLYNQMKVEEKVKTTLKTRRFKISKREKEILELICNGFTNKDIAEKLFLSARTVDNHRANMLTKTGTKNTAELVAFVVKNRLVEI